MKTALYTVLSLSLFTSADIFFQGFKNISKKDSNIKLNYNDTNYLNQVFSNNNTLNTKSENISLYEITNEVFYDNEKFGYKNAVYFVNKSTNSIDKIDLKNSKNNAVITSNTNEKIMTAAATKNYIYYAAIDYANKYLVYRYDPVRNEKVKINGKILNTLQYENATKGDYHSDQSVTLKADEDKLYITHKDFVYYSTTNYGSTTNEYLVVFDGETTARSSTRYIGSFENGTTSYSGLDAGLIAYKNDKVYMALYEGTAGKHSKLNFATYRPTTGKYDDFKSYNISSNKSRVEDIFLLSNTVYAIAMIWDKENKEQTSRYVYKFLDNGKLEKIGSLGSGKETDTRTTIVNSEEIITISYEGIYKVNALLNTVQSIVPATPSILITMSLYKTHNDNILFSQYERGGKKGSVKMLYENLTAKVIPFENAMQTNTGINIEDDPFNSWITTGKYNYTYKFNKDLRLLFKLNFTDKTAEQITFPLIKKHTFIKISDIKFHLETKTIWIKTTYEKSGREVIKYFVYDCNED